MTHLPKNALVVDWDYFFPIDQNWDWGFSELWSPTMADVIWATRAGAFAEAELPRVLDHYVAFWDRFRFAPGTTADVADSNRFALPCLTCRFGLMDKVGVWLFDQHHDTGYHGDLRKNLDNPSCENWMVPLGVDAEPLGSNLHVLYPCGPEFDAVGYDPFECEPEPVIPIDRRYDKNLSPGYLPPVFDHVFVCRSGSWTPPWCDDEFRTFLELCPVNITWECIDLEDREFRYPDELNKLYEQARAAMRADFERGQAC